MHALRRTPWLAKVSTLLVISIFLFAGQVNAAGLFCRSDPVIILSNGVIIDTGVSVDTLPWNVQEVHYELHAPVGTSLVLAIHTPTWISSYETFTFVADQQPGQYAITAVARTSDEEGSAILDATLVSPGLFTSFRLGGTTSAGQVHQWLKVLFRL